jgi:tetratricopeptide (TPR) repeat protein
MNPLEPPDSHHLNAAEGWLELGNELEATAELEQISRDLRAHPDVLTLRWQIHAKAREWDACVEVAQAMMRVAPDRADAWIHHSFALHELKRTQAAYDHLATVAETFPRIWTIPYNLACYCAQLGCLDEAQAWFKKATALDNQLVPQAIADPDLKPLWDSLGTKPSKKA